MQPISPRQQAILNRVVDSHIETAQPVGSRFITNIYTDLYRDSYSSATVRHEMGCLEDMGYLMHPHTSSGRVPTDLGYRYYVDHGLKQEVFPKDYFYRATQDLENVAEEGEVLAEKVSVILATLAEEISLVVMPDRFSLSRMTRRLKLFAQGVSRILEKPEFQDLSKAKRLLKTIEEKIQLMEWLRQCAEAEENSIRIGRENEAEGLWDCAVVSSRCSVAGKTVGTLAVVGPRRMNYSRVVPIVNRMAKILGRILETVKAE